MIRNIGLIFDHFTTYEEMIPSSAGLGISKKLEYLPLTIYSDIIWWKSRTIFKIGGEFVINKNFVTNLKPENRYYPISNVFTTEASIHTNLSRDLYIVLGEGNLNDGWVVKVYHNPLVIWIWIGSLIVFIGGIVSLNNNLKKIKNKKI